MTTFRIIMALCINLTSIYILHGYITIFLDSCRTSKQLELLSYLCFFLGNSLLLIYVNVPLIMFLGNFATLYCLTNLYESNIKERIISTLIIYVILLLSEKLVILFWDNYNFSITQKNQYDFLIELLLVCLVWFILRNILSYIKGVKQGVDLPFQYWLCISIIKRENAFYRRELELMQQNIEQIKSIRHDLKYHFITLSDNLKRGDIDAALAYLETIDSDYLNSPKKSYSGNLEIDSILDFKLEEMRRKNITCQLDLSVPKELKIRPIDLTIILGNLLDNCMEAMESIEEDKTITLSITCYKGTFIITTKNPYIHKLRRIHNKIISLKKDSNNHGIGLKNIEQVAKRYHGNLQVYEKDREFCVRVLLYISDEK